MSPPGRKLFFSLHMKLLILIWSLITVPYLISGIVTYRQYSANAQQEATTYTNQIIEQVSINLDRYLKDMERLSMAPFYDSSVMDVLDQHKQPGADNTYVSSEERARVSDMIASLAIDRSEWHSIQLFTYDGNIFSNQEFGVAKTWNTDSKPSWMKEVEEADGAMVILPPHQVDYYRDGTGKVVSVARAIRNSLPLNQKIGMVKIDLTEQGFEKIVASASFSKNSRVYVSDRDNRLVYPIGPEAEALYKETMANQVGQIYIASEFVSSYTNLKVTGLIPLEDLKRGARRLIRNTLIISLCSLLLAYFAAGLASSRLVQPIRHLQSKMKRVQKGDFSERAIVKTHDEIGQLTVGFNLMVSEIERLVKEVYLSKLREKEVTFQALQNQINPHFIYNVLESINSMALEAKQHPISDVVVSLGRLLRYTVDHKKSFVLLQDEIAFIEAYLQIQASKLGEQLKVEQHIDMSHHGLIVPKLIVQPLIENVIEHAIGTEPVTIKIATRMENDRLMIVVEDNGNGMTAERSAQLREAIYTEGKEDITRERDHFGRKQRGYALRNVHWRLQHLYGESFGLFWEEPPGSGIRFILILPIQYEEMDEV
jgi:two-component system sensor histidine kinase YesM